MKKKLTILASLSLSTYCALALANTYDPMSENTSTSNTASTTATTGSGASDETTPQRQSAGTAATGTTTDDSSQTTETNKSTETKKTTDHGRVSRTDRWKSAMSCTDESGVLHARGSAGFQTCVDMKRKHEKKEQMGGTVGEPVIAPNESNTSGIPLGGMSRGSSSTQESMPDTSTSGGGAP